MPRRGTPVSLGGKDGYIWPQNPGKTRTTRDGRDAAHRLPVRPDVPRPLIGTEAGEAWGPVDTGQGIGGRGASPARGHPRGRCPVTPFSQGRRRSQGNWPPDAGFPSTNACGRSSPAPCRLTLPARQSPGCRAGAPYGFRPERRPDPVFLEGMNGLPAPAPVSEDGLPPLRLVPEPGGGGAAFR
jgi:hypothetical protein